MKNDLAKYWSEDFKQRLHKLRKDCIIRILMCAFIIFTYYFDKNIIHFILAILSGILGVIFIGITIGLYVKPIEVVEMARVKKKNKKDK